MADSSRSVWRPAESPGVVAGPQSQVSPDLIISPGVMVVSTKSGTAAIVTAAPSHFKGVYSVLSTDPQPFTSPLMSATSPSTTLAPTQRQPASSSPTAPPAPSHHLATAKLAAVIVVPLVLFAILSPILVVLYMNRRRKRRIAERRSDRSTKPLTEHYHGAPGASRHYNRRVAVNLPPRKSKNPHKIVSVPTPTFSSFNFELSRPASVRHLRSSIERSAKRVIPRDRRSATLSWGAPPPYTSPVGESHSSTPIPRIDTPSVIGSPLLKTAQMVHLRPISGRQTQLHRSNSRLPSAAESSTSLARSYDSESRTRATMLQPPDMSWSRYGSADSTAESLHHGSRLQSPCSFQGLASPTFSDVSGLSFDPTLWASTTYGRDSIISPIENEDETERTRQHQVL
ncbi:MAG: hypothetical protein Q9209_001758 [Squamulea sp. 1 TL-2023]